MHFLRSILLVSAAFATVASAIPTTPATEDVATVIDSDLDNLGHIMELSTGLTEGLNSNRHTGQDEGVDMTERGQLYVPSESFQKCSGGIALVIVKISLFFSFFLILIMIRLIHLNQSLLVEAITRKLTTMLLSASSGRSLPFSEPFSSS